MGKAEQMRITTAMLDAGWFAGLKAEKKIIEQYRRYVPLREKSRLRRVTRAVIEAALASAKPQKRSRKL